MIFKFNPLHNFISPVTGKLPIDPNYVLIGDRNGMSIGSPILIDLRLDLINLTRDLNQLLETYNKLIDATFVIKYPLDILPNAQAISSLADGFMVNTAGVISTTNVLPPGGLPNLTYKYIWRGDINNRPVESSAVTDLEASNSNILSTLANLASIVGGLASTVSALSSAVNTIENGLASIGGFAAIALLQTQMIAVYVTLGIHGTDIANLQNDVANINNRINNLNFNINLVGDVTGSGTTGSNITTTLQLTLDEIKIAQNTVNLNNQKIINLKSDNVEQQDALNAKFLWDLMHDQVGVVWV